MPIEIFNISFESTQYRQQHGTKITGTGKRKGYGDLIRVKMFSDFDLLSPLD